MGWVVISGYRIKIDAVLFGFSLDIPTVVLLKSNSFGKHCAQNSIGKCFYDLLSTTILLGSVCILASISCACICVRTRTQAHVAHTHA